MTEHKFKVGDVVFHKTIRRLGADCSLPVSPSERARFVILSCEETSLKYGLGYRARDQHGEIGELYESEIEEIPVVSAVSGKKKARKAA